MEDDRGGHHCWKQVTKKVRLKFAKMHVDQPHSFWESVLWIDGTKLELFGNTLVTSALCSQMQKMKHTKKRTLVWNVAGAQVFSGAALSHLAQGALNLCRAQWNLKTVSAFWGEMCSPVSDSWVSVAGHGSSNRIMTQNTELGTTKNGQEQINSDVAFYELNPIGPLWKELK